MKNTKLRKILALVLSVIMLVGILVPMASASTKAQDAKLKFGADGKFTILNFSDIQDGKKVNDITKSFLKKAIEQAKPDLIVLTGDNVYGASCKTVEGTKSSIDGFMKIFEEYKIPVAVTFGNHDSQKNKMTREMQMEYYETFDCNISCDQDPAWPVDMHGCGTYNVPIYSSDGSHIAFNVWVMDSGDYEVSGSGELSTDYDRVHKDQLDWYEATDAALALQNGGKLVPSICFQHIIVKEIYDALVKTSFGDENSVGGDGGIWKLPAGAKGILSEAPCPGVHNDGQFETMKKDVVAFVSGHDHANSFEIDYKGSKLINSTTSGIGAYGSEVNRGARVFVIDEADPANFETHIILMKDNLSQDFKTQFLYFFKNLWYNVEMFGTKLLGYIKAIFKK